MAVSPGHPFFKYIIDNLPTVNSKAEDKINYVLETTGPLLITKLYEQYTTKSHIHLFPTELTSPLSQKEIISYMHGKYDDRVMETKLEKAIAIHYFFGSWYTSQFLKIVGS
jgi:mannosyltransferase OCH1-like enzyme